MEQELKIRLPAREDYDSVVGFLPPPLREVEQVNTYLDTSEAELRERRIMARIRCEGPRVCLTVKWRPRHEAGYFQAEEREADLAARTPEEALETGEARRVLSKLCPETVELPAGALRVVGTLYNRRRRYRLEGFDLELDHTNYGDGAEDFELELETADPEGAAALVRRLLAAAGAQGEPQTRTKYERFLEHVAHP
jgi:uncharacterized protein YjbK